jgi:formyl-CoA transferase
MLLDAGAAGDLPDLLARMPEPEFIASAHVEDVIRRFAAGRTRMEIIEAAQAHGMLGLPVNDASDLIADPFLQDRAFFVQIAHPELEMMCTDIGTPVRLTATPYRIDRRPPRLGEHTDEALARIGVDADAVTRLRQQGVV